MTRAQRLALTRLKANSHVYVPKPDSERAVVVMEKAINRMYLNAARMVFNYLSGGV